MKRIKWLYRALAEMIRKIVMNPVKYAKYLGVNVGENCRFIEHSDWGSEPWLITIGSHVLLSFDVTFVTHDASTWVFRETDEYKNVLKFGEIVIGDNCFIGARSILLPDVHIGDNCIIGAGSLVTSDIPSGEVWGGVPARFITTTKLYADKCKENKLPYDDVLINTDKKKEMLRVLNEKKKSQEIM